MDPEPERRKWRRDESERPFIVHSIFFIMHIALHQSLIVLMWLLTAHRTLHWAHALHPYRYAHSDTLVYCDARWAVTNRLSVSRDRLTLAVTRRKKKNCICKTLKINLNKLSDRKKNFNLFFLILFAFHARHNGELIVISFAGPVIPTTNPLVYAKISCFQFEIIYLENKQKGSRVMRFQCGD